MVIPSPGGDFQTGKADQSLLQGIHTRLDFSLGNTRAIYPTSVAMFFFFKESSLSLYCQ